MRRRTIAVFLLFLASSCCFSVDHNYREAVIFAPGLKAVDQFTLAGEHNLLTDFEPLAPDGTINVVVEIPAGTIQKWEVVKPEGMLKWEFKNGTPRIVEYLGYPGNYGMVPRTSLSKKLGGDDDPLDVLVLGPAVPRGAAVNARLIGVLKMLDQGERDDKLLAVLPDTPLFKAGTLQELNGKFPGVTAIIEIWFANYKGPGKVQVQGFGEAEEARFILQAAMQAFATGRE